MQRVLEKTYLFGMDITPRSEYRAHIAYLTKELELMMSDLQATKENLDKYFVLYNQESGQRHNCENDLIKVKSCKEELCKKNVALNAEVTNLRSGMEKLKQDLNKAEDRAQEYKDKFTLKSQELTELEAIRERECKQYEERIAKLERELRMQEQAYIEIATVHDEDKTKLEALMEATGCAPYPVVNIDKPIPDEVEVDVEETATSDEVEPTELPVMATAEEAEALLEGVEIPVSVESESQISEPEAVSSKVRTMTQEELETTVKRIFYGDDEGAYDLDDDDSTDAADEEPLPSSPLFEGKKTKRNKKHKR